MPRQSFAAVFDGHPGQISLQRIAVPQPRGSETLVRVLGCTLCGSDLHSLQGHRQVPVPTILGHEIVGEIVEWGEDTPRVDLAGGPLQLGDRVTWAIVAHCGKCFYCLRDLPQKCLHAVKYGHEAMRPGSELRGGLADFCLLAPGTSMLRVPESLSLAVACPASCATATVAAALATADELRGCLVAVFGAGMLGLTACAMAASRAAAEVICVDPLAERRTRSLQFGATHSVPPESFSGLAAELSGNHGVDVVLEVSGNSLAFELGLASLRMGGQLISVGSVFPSPPVPLSLEQLVRRQWRLQGIHNYAPQHLEVAMQFLVEAHQRYPFADLVSQWIPLQNTTVAFTLAGGPGTIRVGVVPGGMV